MEIRPFAPTATSTRLGRVLPAVQLRFAASGGPLPSRGVGYTVRYPLPVVPVTATLTTTADTPLVGTLPRPVIWTSMVWPGPTAPSPTPTGVGPTRVSKMRAGSSGWYAPPFSGGGVGY